MSLAIVSRARLDVREEALAPAERLDESDKPRRVQPLLYELLRAVSIVRQVELAT